jgi:hypothetical protein
MSVDIRHMLKVYNYVNDDKRPKVNLKFLGLVAAFLIAGVAITAYVIAQSGVPATAPPPAASKTDYVGLGGADAVPAGGSTGLVQSRVDAWHAAHPGASVDRMDPVYRQGVLVGYKITYTEPPR